MPVVKEVTLRLIRPDERLRWDALMDQQHSLGFKQFAGRGLRYVFRTILLVECGGTP